MTDPKKIKTIFENNDGIMKTAQLSAAKIYYNDIQNLVKEGYIEKVRQGYYLWTFEKDFSEARIISKLFPDGILCMDTALFYYQYSDRTPLQWDIAVSKDSPKSRFNIDYPFVKPYYVEPNILELGLTEGEIDGYPVRIYDKERIICDCIRYVNKMDRETFNKAIQGYLSDPKMKISLLVEYSKKLKVAKRVRDLIGVWL
jgi:predicted transcriptional regulator of viral defense system